MDQWNLNPMIFKDEYAVISSLWALVLEAFFAAFGLQVP
jgi:hypothetical protein